MSEMMKHGYIDIPAQPEPLQGLLWERQELGESLRHALIALEMANIAVNTIVLESIRINEQINEAERQLNEQN